MVIIFITLTYLRLKKILRSQFIWRFLTNSPNSKAYKKALSVEEASKKIFEWIQSNKPFCIARAGNSETILILLYRFNKLFKLNTNKYFLKHAKNSIGVFPSNNKILNQFIKTYENYISLLDGTIFWFSTGEHQIINLSSCLMPFEVYNPMKLKFNWLKALENKNVLIIHPQANLMKEQLNNNRNLWFAEKEILPKFNIIPYSPVITNGENTIEGENWNSSFEKMVHEISQIEFDIALISAGGYGLPLAVEIKKLGKQAIHVAGVLQLWFGIKGKRWLNDERYYNYKDKGWVEADQSKAPIGAEKIEEGAYW